MYGDSITIGQGLIVTVFSMVIVFITLIIISYFIDGLKLFSSGKKQPASIITHSLVSS